MKISNALPAFVVAIGGVGLAKLGFSLGWWVTLLLFFLPTVLIVPLDWYARKSLLPKNPVTALRLMELWVFVPLALAITGAGVTIGIAVAFAEDKSWTTQDRELFKAISSALTAFIAVTLIKSADSADSEWLGSRARTAFWSVYAGDRPGLAHVKGKIYFTPPDSEAERWIFSDPYGGIEGWNLKARYRRAKEVATAIQNGQYVEA